MRCLAVSSLCLAIARARPGAEPDGSCEEDAEPSSLLQSRLGRDRLHEERTIRTEAVCPPEGFDSVGSFNVTDYISAPWYIQMQAETSYQPSDNFFCVRANYTQTDSTWPQSQLELIVDNFAKKGSVSGQDVDDFPLGASITNLSQPSKLVVGPPFLPVFLRGPYWIVAASQQPYEWAIVSGGPPTKQGDQGCVTPGVGLNPNGNGEGLWLLTRETEASNETVTMLVEKASELGFDTSVLLPVQQSGCCGERYGKPC